jgi:hypothetical protein
VHKYWPDITKGIDHTIKERHLREFDRLYEAKECYEYELIKKLVLNIQENRLPKRKIFNWARGLARIRIPTWYNSLIRQRESIQILNEPCELEFDETGNVTDIGLVNSEWMPIVNPPNPYAASPEDLIINCELSQIIKQIPSIVGNLKRKRASEWKRILELQLSGVDVLPKHGKRLGIKSCEVASLKHQALKIAGEILAAIFPELVGVQALFWAQKGKTWHVEKSTFKERCVLFRDPHVSRKIACTLRTLSVIDGGKVKKPDRWNTEMATRKSDIAINDEAA